MRKSLLVIAVLAITLVVVLLLQQHATDDLRAEIHSLRTQLEQSLADTESLSNALARAQSPAPSTDQSRELNRLRNEVGQLRQRVADAAKAGQARASSVAQTVNPTQGETLSDEDRFQLENMHTANAMKQIGLAMHVFAGDNGDRFATNFDGLRETLGGTTNWNQGKITLDLFEFMNAGTASPSTPDYIILREKMPRRTPNGRWIRMYGMADGSVQTQGSDDGNFDQYEKEHSPPAQ